MTPAELVAQDALSFWWLVGSSALIWVPVGLALGRVRRVKEAIDRLLTDPEPDPPAWHPLPAPSHVRLLRPDNDYDGGGTAA